MIVFYATHLGMGAQTTRDIPTAYMEIEVQPPIETGASLRGYNKSINPDFSIVSLITELFRS